MALRERTHGGREEAKRKKKSFKNFKLTNSSGRAMLALSAGSEEWPETETEKIPTARRMPQPIAWCGGAWTWEAAAGAAAWW